MRLFSKDETDFRLNLNDDKWYYKSELNKLDLDSEFPIQVVIYDGNGDKTKFMSLNKDSIAVLEEFLKLAKQRL